MAAASDWLEAGLLNVFRGTAFPLSNTGSVHISLHTTATTDAGGGTEVSAGGYARVAVSKAAGSWSAPAAAGVISNSNVITFGPASANWGTVVSFALFDAATAGNMIVHGALTASKTINDGDSASFGAGSLSITVS